MFRYTSLFTTHVDPTGEKSAHTEQKIAEWLFGHLKQYATTDHAFSAVASVAEMFPPAHMKDAITPALIEQVKDAFQAWQQALQDHSQPTRAEAKQAGKELLLLILREIHPDYVEAVEEDGQAEKADLTVVDQTLLYLRGRLAAQKFTGEQEFYEVALEATQLLKALGESSTYPHPYAELPYVPALLFPVKNPMTGKTIWIEMAPSTYGFYITAHKRKPQIKDINTWSHSTGMAGLHVDYYVAPTEDEPELTKKGTPRQCWKRPQEMLKVQLHDEAFGPYSEPHWQIPTDYSYSMKDASIVLIRDVQRWKPTRGEEDASGNQDEAPAADGQDEEGGHRA